MLITLTVKYNVEGFHCWATAPPARGYLANRHRHQFFVTVSVEVGGNDREIEFHDLLDTSKRLFTGGELGTLSCEQIAINLINALAQVYPGRSFSVSIFEDDEVGATVVSS